MKKENSLNIFKQVLRNQMESSVMEAIKEDRAFSDITTQMCVQEDAEGIGRIICKEKGILSGIQFAEVVMQSFGTYVVDYKTEDGMQITPGDILAEIKGKLRGIISGERITLNYIQRMSGIATFTNSFVKKAEKKNIKILDTRKTTPTLRFFEKYAVACGGGINHRMDLFSEVMIKDNHLEVLKYDLGVVNRMKNKYPDRKIVLEVDDMSRIEDALKYPIDRIMLDNFTPDGIREAVGIINRRCEIEVSGNISENTLDKYLIDGVNFISVGKLTHSYKSLDISMEVIIV